MLGSLVTFGSLSGAHAATVSLTASNTLGTSSFNSALSWSNGDLPSAANTYFTESFRLRTPADSGSYAFGGASLTVNNTTGIEGGLTYKGTGTTGVITVSNLILDGGYISSLSSYADLFQLAGNITVTANGGTIQAKQSPITISSIISGSGLLTVGASDNTGGNALTFSAMNTFTGNLSIVANGNFVLGSTGGLVFDINAGGLSNAITGTGIAAFNGTFTFDLTGVPYTEGDMWAIVDIAGLTETFGATFQVADFTEVDNVWTSSDGLYQFNEATGLLTAIPVPEPSTVATLLLGGLVFIAKARRFRRPSA